ncbi:hypothetical protein CI109_103116 [Kwoniella shandongensis]|uniref:Uncharacterized protein n=1 Tax=Kwoniella shandongensis TaxID=1734106 RepID=A0A5M6CDE0_9TREE|nr:uncharacterized protein CI109_000306 [Kwoniella shandongensis]KAA5531465.1 hypothetical protein CI109_000306 [Kwoniella shandongensis]
MTPSVRTGRKAPAPDNVTPLRGGARAGPGPSSLASRRRRRQDKLIQDDGLDAGEGDEADPLAMSPIRSTPRLRSSTTKRVPATQYPQGHTSSPAPTIPSSTPTTATARRGRTFAAAMRVTRAAKRKDREEEEELGGEGDVDLIAPSEDEEYERWREGRRARLVEQAENGPQAVGSQAETEGERERKEQVNAVRPKKPDKGTMLIIHNTPHRPKHIFQTLLPSPPQQPRSRSALSQHSQLSSPSLTSTSRSISRETSPTQPLSYSQNGDDPFFPVYTLESESVEPRRWEESDDELDLIGRESLDLRKENVQDGRETGSKSPKVGEADAERSSRQEDKLEVQNDVRMSAIDKRVEPSLPDPPDPRSPSPRRSSTSSTPQTVPILDGYNATDFLQDEGRSGSAEHSHSPSRSNTPQTMPIVDGYEFTNFHPALPESGPPVHSFSPLQVKSPLVTLESPPVFETFGPFSILPRSFELGVSQVQSTLSPAKSVEPLQSQSPSSSPSRPPSQPLFDKDLPRHPSKSPTPDPPRGSSPGADLSDVFAAVAESTHAPPPPAPVSLPPADPALEQFRTARTFRTRTVLQLQPYTKERQIYEAALRKGGLKKGKKAIADAREITPNEEDKDEEGQVDESSEASVEAVEASERIVIGNTPPSKKARTPRALTDADYDEYFLEHGTAADETDPEVFQELQQIAKRRLRAAKEDRRRLKDAEREKKQFDRLMREMHGEKTGSEDSGREQEKQPEKRKKEPPKARADPVRRTPGGTKTYARKERGRPQPPLPPSSGSENETPPPAFPLPLVSPAKSHTGTPTASFRTAVSGSNDIDIDIGYGQPQSFAFDEFPLLQSPSLRQNSFIVDDISRSPPIRAQILDSDSQSDSNSSDTSAVHDTRKKIARRMMPAAMLKRLEAEELARQKRKEEKKRREQRATTSPMRPGRAVVRRGGGHGGQDDIAAMFSDQEDDDDTPQLTPFRPLTSNSIGQPIVVSDGNDSSSEAAEDNQTEQTLARLHRGDFEGIVAGNRWKSTEPKRRVESRTKHRSSHARRPALGLVKRVRAPLSEGNRAMVQTRIDFPTSDKSLVQPTKKRKRKSQHSHKTRPAIRLDDHVIFATADFEFESQDEDRAVPPRPAKIRPFARTKSTSLPAPAAAAVPTTDFLDAGIGKARSWANFDRFPIDFDITPLPSGLYCNDESIPGSGRLRTLVGQLRGEPTETEATDSVTAYGLDLSKDMTSTSLQEVLGLVFDAIYRQIVAIANDDAEDSLDLSPFAFLGSYVTSYAHDTDEHSHALGSGIEDAIRQLNIKLDSIDVTRSRARSAKHAMLQLRWALCDLAIHVAALKGGSDPTSPTLFQECVVYLICQLLSAGFDKTIRPLKLIMRGEADSAEITDLSITLWISLIHCTSAWDQQHHSPEGTTFISSLSRALDQAFHLDQTGPIAAERIWFLIFGLCALSQFDVDGKISSVFISVPRWSLVRRAVSLIKVAFDEEGEKKAKLDQLQGRDRYVKVMMARCIRLSAVWRWSFDRESFSVATRDLGVIFKNRQYRNLPTEPSVDYPDFITRFDMSLTAAEDTKRETAFELYLRLVCVAASDIILTAQSLTEAQQAERDVQRLVMSIIPVSAVKFNRIFPPSAKDLGQLINRYSTMIAACYFSPSLLSYLLANSRKWSLFEQADFDSRQICIRGLMYLAVACRHHQQPLTLVVDRLAEILSTLQGELEVHGQPSTVAPALAPGRLEIERTMVLVVTCFRQIIKHHSFDVEEQAKAVYPDPCLLHQSWTIRIFDLELAKDLKCGLEVIATIQAFLDTRASALPRLARQRREAKEKESHQSESMDEFGSLGIDFSDVDVLALGGEVTSHEEDPVERQDKEFAEIIESVISPKIYRLLSDMLPPVTEDDDSDMSHEVDRQMFISKLTKCWSDCASVLVVEHQKLDWSTFISPFGRQSWARLGDERGRVQVGLHFMLNVAQLDPGSFIHHEEDFIALFFQIIGTDRVTVEHEYVSSLLIMQGAMDHPLLTPLAGIEMLERELDRNGFMDVRGLMLRAIFEAIPDLLRSQRTPASTKSFVYRCINLLVSSLISYEKSIDPTKVIHKESYHAFVATTIKDLTRLAGEYMTPLSVPGLKQLL